MRFSRLIVWAVLPALLTAAEPLPVANSQAALETQAASPAPASAVAFQNGSTVQESAPLPVAHSPADTLQHKKQLPANSSEELPELPPELKSFYSENAPDYLQEYNEKLKENPQEAKIVLSQLEKRYNAIHKFIINQPEEYFYLLNQLKTDYKIREQCRKIQAMAQDESRQSELLQLTLELKENLETAFDETQKRQLIKLALLENEIKGLKQIIDDRAANKQKILKQKLMLLTGQEW